MNEFRKQVGEYLNQTYYAGKAFTLLKGNRPMAALVPMSMLERLAQLEDQLANQVAAADQAANQSIDDSTE